MASENLNRAFIKAYGKGMQPVSGSTPASKPAASIHDPYLVRFDTATVQSIVPQMHNPRPPFQGSVAVGPAQSPQPLVAHRVQSDPVTAHRFVSPQDLGRSNSSVINEPAESEAEFVDSTLLSDMLGGTTMVVPTINLGNRQTIVASNQPAAGRTETAPLVDSSATPLNASNTKTQSGSRQSTSETLETRIANKNRGGDIFRLDRPSYSGDFPAGDAFLEDELSSPSDVTDEEIARRPSTVGGQPQAIVRGQPSRQVETYKVHSPMPPKTPPQSDHRHHAIAKERDLRQARMRIFNPLWEVDRLEWPRVCAELLTAIDAESPGVAKNLINACQDGLQVLAITSPAGGSGTSTVACCLAMLAGRHGLNIALVDGNTENPSLCYQTNLDLEVDWHEAVARQVPIEEVAVHSVDDQVTLVPLLARLNAPQLNEQNVALMLRELSQSFDLVIVDLGHMASSRNMVATLGDLGALNAVIAVVDRRNITPERIESCLRQIRQTGVASIGLVENFAT